MLSLCGAAAAAVAADLCLRGLRILMRSQGQGGKATIGQSWMPTVKGAKKRALFRGRKNPGSHGARKVPRRYPLYDLLEEYDKTLPTYTVVWEPEEPMKAVEDVPLLERYPWANSLKKVNKKKQEMESGDDKMERLFGSYTRENLPPMSRRQKYVPRMGYPHYNYPPWINRPLAGTELQIPAATRWKKDRRPTFEQLPYKEQEAILLQQAMQKQEPDPALVAVGDDVDDALDAMESEP